MPRPVSQISMRNLSPRRRQGRTGRLFSGRNALFTRLRSEEMLKGAPSPSRSTLDTQNANKRSLGRARARAAKALEALAARVQTPIHRSRIGSKFLMNVAATSRRRLKGLIPAVLNYGRRTFRASGGVLVARAISSPTFLLNVGVSSGAISLQYIHSRADLCVLITFSKERLFSVPF
jgi:hypothetical protein